MRSVHRRPRIFDLFKVQSSKLFTTQQTKTVILATVHTRTTAGMPFPQSFLDFLQNFQFSFLLAPQAALFLDSPRDPSIQSYSSIFSTMVLHYYCHSHFKQITNLCLQIYFRAFLKYTL